MFTFEIVIAFFLFEIGDAREFKAFRFEPALESVMVNKFVRSGVNAFLCSEVLDVFEPDFKIYGFGFCKLGRS